MRTLLLVASWLALPVLGLAQQGPARPPIIDVHLHAYSPSTWTTRPPNPVTGQLAPVTSEAHMRATLAAMDRYNIVAGIVSGPLDQVYMDVAVINWIGGPDSKPRFHSFLREMLENGLGKRIMFGTDQMRWPEAIGMAVDFVESAEGLTPEQKRDILYNNAARFLKLQQVGSAR